MLKVKIDTNIFLVDHNHEFTRSINNSIDNPEKYNITSFASGEKFIAFLADYKFSKNNVYIVFLGYKYFDEGNNTLMNGVEILESTKAINKDIEVVMLTGEDEGSFGSYVMKSGAFAFIPKNENIHLRINNIIMGIISQKRLIQKRRNFYLSIKVLFFYIIIVTIIWAIYRFYYYDF